MELWSSDESLVEVSMLSIPTWLLLVSVTAWDYSVCYSYNKIAKVLICLVNIASVRRCEVLVQNEMVIINDTSICAK